MAIISKKWRQNASNTAVEAALRAGGAGVAATLLHKVTKADFTEKSDLNKTIGNIAAPLLSAVAVAGDLFLEHPYLKAMCQGMYSFSLIKSASVIMPSIGNYTGLKGVQVRNAQRFINGVRPRIMNGTPSTGYRPALQRPQTANQEAFAKVAEIAEQTVNTASQINGVKGSLEKTAESML